MMSSSALKSSKKSISYLAKDYIKTSSYFINISKAIGRFKLTYKNVVSLARTTQALYEALENINTVSRMTFEDMNGKYIKADYIRFEKVKIIDPEGDILIDSMDFTILQGMHTMVQGPHGSGKSSIFRILSGLWPLQSGTIYSPLRENIFYISNVPYLPFGSLKSQFSYPRPPEENDEVVKKIVQVIKAEKLLEKYDLNSIED